VAAPYNMQVSPLKRARQEGIAWAGLDGQGRGGSDRLTGDYLSRSMDFLFSKIQLNVALSRARSLALLMASPDGLKVKCKPPEQMALVNL
jgi:hypothetical protein